MDHDINCKFFVLQISQLIPQLQLTLLTFNPQFTLAEMVDFVVQAHYLPVETRWEELKEELVNLVLEDSNSNDKDSGATIYQYEWCVQRAETIIGMIETGYYILYHHLYQYVPYHAVDGYVYNGLTINQQGIILKYSKQDIF